MKEGIIAFSGVFEKEVKRFLKIPLQSIGTPIISNLLYYMIFGLTLGSQIHITEDIPYIAFLVPGLAALALIRNCFENASGSIIGAKYVRELQDLRITPLTTHQILWAKASASLLRGICVALISYGIGWSFCFISHGYILGVSHMGALLFFLITSGLTFANLGIALTMKASSFEQVGAITSFIISPLIYLGGVFFRLEALHPFWQQVSQFNPLIYTVNGIRYGILGKSDVNLFTAALVCIFTTFITYLFAKLSLKNSSNYFQ